MVDRAVEHNCYHLMTLTESSRGTACGIVSPSRALKTVPLRLVSTSIFRSREFIEGRIGYPWPVSACCLDVRAHASSFGALPVRLARYQRIWIVYQRSSEKRRKERPETPSKTWFVPWIIYPSQLDAIELFSFLHSGLISSSVSHLAPACATHSTVALL